MGDFIVKSAAALTFFFFLGTVVWYVPLIIKRRVVPAPATWVLLTVGMHLALGSYHLNPETRWLSNVGLYAATIEITIVFTVMMVVMYRSGDLTIAFDRVQQLFVVIMVGVIVYWVYHKEEVGFTYKTVQALLVASYLASFSKALQKRSAFDSIGNWGAIFLASCFSCIPAFMKHETLSEINSLRGTISSGALLALLVYYDRKTGYARIKDELSAHASMWRTVSVRSKK